MSLQALNPIVRSAPDQPTKPFKASNRLKHEELKSQPTPSPPSLTPSLSDTTCSYFEKRLMLGFDALHQWTGAPSHQSIAELCSFFQENEGEGQGKSTSQNQITTFQSVVYMLVRDPRACVLQCRTQLPAGIMCHFREAACETRRPFRAALSSI